MGSGHSHTVPDRPGNKRAKKPLALTDGFRPQPNGFGSTPNLLQPNHAHDDVTQSRNGRPPPDLVSHGYQGGVRTLGAGVKLPGSDSAIIEYVADSIVGKDVVFEGPFGKRKVMYLDYIASGKPLTFIEDFISKEVLPTYANTHTSTSCTARQTTALRNEAREIIHETSNCTEKDVVIFTGNGATGAVHKLIHGLDLREPPVVFSGPYEHHSNILPWREMHAEVVRIGQTSDGLVDLAHLEKELQKWSGSERRLIGSMTAASNVTGILCDVDAVSVLLHRYGALAFWDYATAGPYVQLDMNPVIAGKYSDLAYKDAIFLSPHKFVGGVSSPGLLIAKKHLFVNKVPHNVGGGTVLVVRQTGHRYLSNLEDREEGGTPNIVGAIRAGLTFQLKAAITSDLIMQRERELFRRAREAWDGLPNLVILGNLDVERLPIFSILIHHQLTGLYLHYNFVACLLNDLFGIQARGGCACAGPYAMDLLGIPEEQAIQIEDLLITESDGKGAKRNSKNSGESLRDIFKPGFTRLNLPFFLTEDQLDFVLQAVAMVAEHGWKLLPQYTFNPKSGEWKHEHSQEYKQQKHLGQLSYSTGHLECHLPTSHMGGDPPASLDEVLARARQIFITAERSVKEMADQTALLDDFALPSRWFLLPSEASQILSMLSQITALGPAKVFLAPTPRHTQLSGMGGKAVSMETLSNSSSNDREKKKRRKEPPKRPAHVHRIRVQGYAGDQR